MTESLINGPSVGVYSGTHGLDRKSESLAKVRHAAGNSCHREDSISAPVSGLLFLGLPLAISGLIALVIVNSSDCQTVRTLAHIRQEIGEIHPSRAHAYSPASVILPRLGRAVSATINHSQPGIVCLAVMPGPSVTMLQEHTILSLLPSATARFSSAMRQRSVQHRQIISALTPTKRLPKPIARWRDMVGSISDYFKPSKRSTDEGYFRGHNDVQTIVSLSGGRPATTGARCDYPFIPAWGAQA